MPDRTGWVPYRERIHADSDPAKTTLRRPSETPAKQATQRTKNIPTAFGVVDESVNDRTGGDSLIAYFQHFLVCADPILTATADSINKPNCEQSNHTRHAVLSRHTNAAHQFREHNRQFVAR